MTEVLLVKLDPSVYPERLITCRGCGAVTTTRWIPWCRSACWLVCGICGLVSKASPVPR